MYIGVDTHKKTHVLVALDTRGQTCGTQTVANTPADWANYRYAPLLDTGGSLSVQPKSAKLAMGHRKRPAGISRKVVDAACPIFPYWVGPDGQIWCTESEQEPGGGTHSWR